MNSAMDQSALLYGVWFMWKLLYLAQPTEAFFIQSMLATSRGCSFKWAIYKRMMLFYIASLPCVLTLRCMPLELDQHKSTLAYVMARCRQSMFFYQFYNVIELEAVTDFSLISTVNMPLSISRPGHFHLPKRISFLNESTIKVINFVILNIPLKMDFIKYTVLSHGYGRRELWCISHYGFPWRFSWEDSFLPLDIHIVENIWKLFKIWKALNLSLEIRTDLYMPKLIYTPVIYVLYYVVLVKL